MLSSGAINKLSKTRPKANPQLASLEQDLRTALGTKVELKQTGRGRGKITIHFKSNDEFERIISQLVDE